MNLIVSREITDIFKEIDERNISLEEWKEIESSDMFQSKSFNGGFDAIENEFCFSFYYENKEYWFQFNLKDIESYFKGDPVTLQLRPAE